MIANDIDLDVAFRVPSLSFDGEGRFGGARWLQRSVPAVLRGVDADAFLPFPDDAPECLRHYRIHRGRTWLPIPRCGEIARPWEALRFEAPCEVARVVSALGGTPEWVGLAALGRTPLSIRRAHDAPHLVSPSSAPAEETLLPRAAGRVAALFEHGLAHDGTRVWAAVPPPMLHAPARQGRGARAILSTPSEIPPQRGPASHASRAGAYLEIALRHRSLAHARQSLASSEALRRACADEGVSEGDEDVDEFVADLPGTALQWASYAVLRRGATLPPTNRLHALLPLAEAGLLSREERDEALDLGIEMARAVLAAAPDLRNWRHLAWVADHAEAFVRPLLLAERTVPEGDAEALGALAR